MPASAQQAWRLLQSIESVAACMPGAKITERLDDSHYKGTVTVKFGPATMSFRGEIEVREVNPALIVETIARHRVTHTFLVPTVVQALLMVPGVEEADLSSLQLLM
ncbi:MAG: SRPBCC domain-containing protein, partial [Hylemonella sp.]